MRSFNTVGRAWGLSTAYGILEVELGDFEVEVIGCAANPVDLNLCDRRSGTGQIERFVDCVCVWWSICAKHGQISHVKIIRERARNAYGCGS